MEPGPSGRGGLPLLRARRLFPPLLVLAAAPIGGWEVPAGGEMGSFWATLGALSLSRRDFCSFSTFNAPRVACCTERGPSGPAWRGLRGREGPSGRRGEGLLGRSGQAFWAGRGEGLLGRRQGLLGRRERLRGREGRPGPRWPLGSPAGAVPARAATSPPARPLIDAGMAASCRSTALPAPQYCVATSNAVSTTSAMLTSTPSAASEVTSLPAMPQGTM